MQHVLDGVQAGRQIDNGGGHFSAAVVATEIDDQSTVQQQARAADRGHVEHPGARAGE